MTRPFTLIEDGRAHALAADVAGDRVRIPAAALSSALGFELKPEGLCQGETCFPVRDRAALVAGDALDLAELARVTGRPLALDVAERAGALGIALDDRLAALRGLEAPDFTLPDFSGREHTLSAYRGKKVLLIAYSSW
jgi:AhpC/TSA family